MYIDRPVTERVKGIRERCRNTPPKVDISRYRLVTEFYMNNPQLTGILKRAKNLHNLFEHMPTLISEDELIVGCLGSTYRDSPLFPEISWNWFMEELRSDNIRTRSVDPYRLDEEDEKYLLETGDFWLKNTMSAIADEYMPRKMRELDHSGVIPFNAAGCAHAAVGHFTANFWTATQKGFGAIRDEARAKLEEIEEKGLFGEDVERYHFYRAVDIVCDGIILWSKRYGAEAARQAEACSDPVRKAELLDMAERMNWIMEHPCRSFHDAIQCVWFYQIAMCLDGQLHGISFGRMDQYLGRYYERDLAEGRITPEKAQELVDLFMLKVAETNKIWSEMATKSNPGYTAGMLITLGGVDMEGRDATNPVTYMFLQASRRLSLNCPQALRVHEGTPEELWEAAIECTKVCGGIPTFESDIAIIPAMMKRGVPLEYARNYCLEGCVEPTIGGYEWGQPGGDGTESYINIVNAFLMAINNGINPLTQAGAAEPKRQGPATGYLYEMNSMEEVMAAVKTQFEFWMPWHANCTNAWESMAAFHNPLPMVSAAFTGCMESGKDVMRGGAMFNSTGNSCIGIGNVADSLNCIDQVCFKKKLATTRELYDALMANWEGYEELRQQINGSIPRFGNGDPECDKYMTFAADAYADSINRCMGTRGDHYAAGCYPVTLNVVYGAFTAATPDGRKRGEPLADGISPVQGMDKNGPIATMQSLLTFDYTKFGNGTLCNMKFHPTALAAKDGLEKLVNVLKAYFEQGGMELQLNIISGETLRDAQEHPENYRDLVVRVAGFSAYFVEVFKDMQDDLIRRTEMMV